jgi:hypothetical protein
MLKSNIKASPAGTEILIPRLNIPDGVSAKSRPQIRIKQLERWTAELPIGNTTVASHQMLEKIKTLNSCRYSYKDRLQLHNTLRSVFTELLHAIRQPLRQASIPLDQQQLYRANLLQTLLEHMALGYKLVVQELATNNHLKEYDQMLLTESIYLAMTFLSQRLVDAYGMYATEPTRVWSDIHQLYKLAEARQLLQQQVDDPYPDTPLPIQLNIDFVYKRIVLLSLAEPYHLMQYEADDMYRLIASSVTNCVIEPFSEFVTRGEYLIDLGSDSGPRFISTEHQWQPLEPRLVDMSAVKLQLNIHLQRLLSSSLNAAEFESVSLIERQQRDMLLRLADAWNAMLVRTTQRFSLSGKVELSSGLNASHHYISGGQPFTPELDELRLVSHSERTTPTESNDTIFATAYQEALQKDRIHEHQSYPLNPWLQKNISPIGIALNCKQTGNHIDVRVGELVTYRMADKKFQRWQIGVIRWLQHEFTEEAEGNVNVGIMNIANGAVTVGSKAIKGLGSGTDYFRSLLVPRQVSLNQTRSLILPALLYDVGTVLAINLKQRLFYAKLTRMLLSTRSFTQFDFEIIKRPVDNEFYL